MRISRERLEKEASLTGFRPEILEKVLHLLELLQSFASDKFLSSRIVLKGGTALNLFYYKYPRLSVDIDINYIGAADREKMMEERKLVISIIKDICLDKNYQLQRVPSEHAGGKWTLRYQTALQGNPRLEVDLNFLTRIPLWSIELKNSHKLGSYQAYKIPILDKHELAGGKLKALFSRHSSRDLFDAHQILLDNSFDIEKLRIAFLVYGGMSRIDWRTISPDNINFSWIELRNMLLPMLRNKDNLGSDDSEKWVSNILTDCRTALGKLLPLRKNECEFMNYLLDYGEIKPELLTSDTKLAEKIQLQPGLQWKALHVKKYKGRI